MVAVVAWSRVNHLNALSTQLNDFFLEALAMKKCVAISLICIAVPASALPDPYQPPPQILFEPVTNYQKGQAERLRQEQMRLENELRQQEIERRNQAAHDDKDRLRLQREEEQRSRSIAVQAEENTNRFGVDPVLANTLDQLDKLGELKKEGVLTDEEFKKLKKEILDAQASPTGDNR